MTELLLDLLAVGASSLTPPVDQWWDFDLLQSSRSLCEGLFMATMTESVIMTVHRAGYIATWSRHLREIGITLAQINFIPARLYSREIFWE